MITDRLMSVGEWGLEMVPETPERTRAAFDWGHVLFVTPTRFDRSVSVANLQATAVYAGLVFRIGGGRRRFGGPGLLGYLQTGKGEAGAALYSAYGPGDFDALLSSFLFAAGHESNGLTKGTDYSSTATTITFEAGTAFPPTKSVVDTAAATTGNEYRVNPDGTVDYGVSTSLFRSTPIVALSPGMSGVQSDMRVLETTQWDVTRNIDNYRNRGWAVTNDGTFEDTSLGGSPTDAVSFSTYTGLALALYYSPLTSTQTDDHTELTAIAGALADAYVAPAMEIECSVREFCIPRFITPGDWIWVYSVDDDLKDTANQVVFQGQTLFPKKIRCVGYTYPIEAGMGVYTYDTTNDVVTDVSDYVAWETGRETSLELESKPQSLFDVGERSVLL